MARLVLLALLLFACGGGAAPAAPTATVAGDVVVITQQDQGRTIPLAVDQLVQVSLGDAVDWTLSISDPAVLSAEPGKNTLVRGTQLLARAHRAGTAVIDGEGRPRCPASQPCPQYIATFQVTIVVR
jgi:hypothetical protein